MKSAIVLAGVAGLLASPAAAQVLAVQVKDGNVYVQQPQGWGRLTQDGRATEAAKSRDGSLIAYVHNEGAVADEELPGHRRPQEC